jgi:rhodanese-related sulfurtransferase
MVPQISVATARDWLAQTDGAPLLLDVREGWEVAIAALPNAQHIPMGQLVARVSEIDATRSVIVFCHHGVRSLQVVAFLQRQGFDDVHNLFGGIDAWSKTIDSNIALY